MRRYVVVVGSRPPGRRRRGRQVADACGAYAKGRRVEQLLRVERRDAPPRAPRRLGGAAAVVGAPNFLPLLKVIEGRLPALVAELKAGALDALRVEAALLG